MITSQFKKAYRKLNKEQRQAVDWIEGPVMVIAGPGTGKTQILTMRLANILLKTHVNPENILALTFSESASFEMRERLSKIIGTPAFRVEISTFHSFANNIIRSYPDEFPWLLSSESITEIEQLEMFEKLLESGKFKLLKPFGDPLYYLKDILSAIDDLKKEGIAPEKLEEATGEQEKDFNKIADLYHAKGKYEGQMKGEYQELKKNIEKVKEFIKIFKAYQKSLREEKKYDFNDMLLEVIKVFEGNKYLLLRIQEKYQYILIDEHQDTNAAQNKLVELAASFYKTPNLFVVGDANQAIYRFQGASLENFLYFKKLYKGAKLINLQKNYRSHQLILDASKSLIEKNISANILSKQNLIAELKYKKEKIQLGEFTDFGTEYEYVAEDIQKKIKSGCNYSNIAVLARRNADLFPLAQCIKRRGIKFIIQTDLDILSDIQIQKLILLLKAVNSPFEEVLLSQAMHTDFLGIEPFDIYRVLDSKKQKRKTLPEILDQVRTPQTIRDFYFKYKGWIKLNNNIPFDDLFVKVVNESGFREYILKLDERYEVLRKLTGLFDQIKLQLSKNTKFNLSNFLTMLEQVEKHKINFLAKESVDKESVKLLTVHKSKGLEFDYVYLINLFEGRWGTRKRGVKIKIPWRYLGQAVKADIALEELEDERRLFYVALTRAKRGIILTYAKAGIEGREQLASQFIKEINQKFIKLIDTKKFEENFDQIKIFETRQNKWPKIKDQKYLQSLFSQRQLSVTALENFLECPWKYFFRNLVVLPDVKNKHLIYGTAIHYALDSYLRVRLRNPKLQFLTGKFKEVLEKEALPETEMNELLGKGVRALTLLHDNVLPSWPKNVQSELVIKGVNFSDGIILGGRIDMIEPLSSDGSVRVHDFKTGKAKSRSQIDGNRENSKYNYFRQLVFYRILLERYKGGFFKMKEGVIDFVEPDEKDRFRSEVFEVRDKDVKELAEIIRAAADQITDLKFWDSTCKDQKCDYCKLRAMVW